MTRKRFKVQVNRTVHTTYNPYPTGYEVLALAKLDPARTVLYLKKDGESGLPFPQKIELGTRIDLEQQNIRFLTLPTDATDGCPHAQTVGE